MRAQNSDSPPGVIWLPPLSKGTLGTILEACLVVTIWGEETMGWWGGGREEVVLWLLVGRDRGAGKYPMMHRTAPRHRIVQPQMTMGPRLSNPGLRLHQGFLARIDRVAGTVSTTVRLTLSLGEGGWGA